MKIAVLGAGAVGCYYGGLLARGGHDVTLIGRPAHVAAIESHGLFFETAQWRAHIPIRASTDSTWVRHADTVLFCVKSGDTESAGAAIAPFLKPDAVVYSLQNGVDNAERLQALVSQKVVPVVVYVAAGMEGPGHVRHNGRGELVLGTEAVCDAFVAACQAAQIPVERSGAVTEALWNKLVINCAYNALSAITQQPYGKLVQTQGVGDLIDLVVAECLAVATAKGLSLPADLTSAVHQIAVSMAPQRSSTARDLARGKTTEVEHINGYIVREGRRLGVPTPVNATLQTLVKVFEDRQTLGAQG
ncbi:MAG: ketopantoate reductase ApbA [Pseudomonadota bacterium]